MGLFWILDVTVLDLKLTQGLGHMILFLYNQQNHQIIYCGYGGAAIILLEWQSGDLGLFPEPYNTSPCLFG